MRLFGLIGFPLEQSFSKTFFTKKFEMEGLTDCRFENFPIRGIEALPELLQQHQDLKGLAVTIPYKKAVIPYLAKTSLPEGLQACNCIRVEQGGLHGFNTDHIGFAESFLPLLKPFHRRALVLGNGGSAEAVSWVLRQHHIPFVIVSRRKGSGAVYTYEELDQEVLAEYNIIINTTPLGMFPDTGNCPPIPYTMLTAQHYLYDLVYNPAETLFLQKGREQGALVKNGADMLVIQAEANWQIWNEKP